MEFSELIGAIGALQSELEQEADRCEARITASRTDAVETLFDRLAAAMPEIEKRIGVYDDLILKLEQQRGAWTSASGNLEAAVDMAEAAHTAADGYPDIDKDLKLAEREEIAANLAAAAEELGLLLGELSEVEDPLTN